MTREEAIEELQSYADASWGSLNEAFEMAINALRPRQPGAGGEGEGRTTEGAGMIECIKREDAINLLWLYADESCASVVSDFESLPAVPVVRCRECKYGKCGVDNMVRCSHPCGKVISMTAEDFCSYGACMDIAGEESIC